MAAATPAEEDMVGNGNHLWGCGDLFPCQVSGASLGPMPRALSNCHNIFSANKRNPCLPSKDTGTRRRQPISRNDNRFINHPQLESAAIITPDSSTPDWIR